MKTLNVMFAAMLVAVTLSAPDSIAYLTTASSLNVRTGPGTGYRVIRTLSYHTYVEWTAKSGSWTKIDVPVVGWVSSAYLTPTPKRTSTSSGSDFVWPASGRCTATWRYRSGALHAALDIAGPYGQAIIAPRSGYVNRRYWSGGYGYLVSLRYSGGYETYHAHNSRYGSSGSVSRGTVVAYEGSTGNSSGPHSHFEIRRYGSRLWIPGYVGQTIYRGRGVPYNYSGI